MTIHQAIAAIPEFTMTPTRGVLPVPDNLVDISSVRGELIDAGSPALGFGSNTYWRKHTINWSKAADWV